MRLVEIKHITNNLDSRRIPLNSSQRAEKETNPMYPYIGANNIMAYIDEYIFDDKILCIAEDGGSWGFMQTCAKIYNEKVWVNNHAHVLTAKEEIVLEYLMYYLNFTDLSLHINGATRGKLTKSSLNNIKVPLPPLEEQKKIAAILDAADEYRQKTKALINKYDQLTQSLFLDMFGDPVTNSKGWIKKTVLEIAKTLFAGGDVPKNYFSKERNEDYNIPIYSNGLNEKALYGFTNIAKVHEESVTLSARGTIGHPEVRKAPFYPIIRLIVITPKTDIVLAEYLKRALSFLEYRKGGTSIPQLTVPMVKNKEVLTPPIELQNHFAEKVAQIEKQKQQAEASLVKAEELFSSLLQRAFKGELTN